MKTIWQYRGDLTASHSKDHSKSKLDSALIEAAGGSPLIAKLLVNRGVKTAAEIDAFLNLEKYTPTSALELPDMPQAFERVQKAIADQENILIYGDFDVDGMTGTSILYETLLFLGAQVTYYIPDRATEGHGLNTAAAIRLASSRKLKLVITTDTGITNFAEISLLKNLGVDTIVTDHHELPENLPPSIANVNPKLLPDQSHPLAPLCGAGVAYKLCELLLNAVGTPEALERLEALLDLVAIGTVADLASLLKENRYLVYRGLQVLNKRQRKGVNEILQNAGTNPDAKLTSETVGFTIAPRLNALGRLENATEAVELLTTQDPDRARIIAAHLEQLNRQRRELCDQTFLQAEQFLNQTGGLGDKRAIILGSTQWNLGIIGIVASRLVEKYHVPAFLMVVNEEKGEVRCSGRSIPGFHLHDELLPLSDLFLGFGGHAGAGGFSLSIEQLGIFKERLYAIAAQKITPEHMKPTIEVDGNLDWSQINPHLVSLLHQVAPFGMDNPSPKFVVENAHIQTQRGLGEDERHLKLVLKHPGSKDNQNIEALYWNYGKHPKLDTSLPYHFVVSPELNTFNNLTKVQLILDDFRPAVEAKPTQYSPSPSPLPQGEGESVSPIENAPLNMPTNRPTDSTLTASSPASPASVPNAITWIDHRSRDSVESFVGQLMMPLQESRSVLIYHEGRRPDIAFLDDQILVNRLSLKKADELILWDLPPEREILHTILKIVQPTMIHLVGGKYQSIPVFQTETNLLKLMLQYISRATQAIQGPLQITPRQLASQLSLSTPTLLMGLTLLEKTAWLQTRIQKQDDQSLEETLLLITPQPQGPQGMDPMQLVEHLEYGLFRQALRDAGQFRHWLLTHPLDKIQRAFASEFEALHLEHSVQEESTHVRQHVLV